MHESDFSWLKILSFFLAALLVFAAFGMIAGGIYLINGGYAFNGVTCFIGAILSGFGAVVIYKYYQKKSKN